MSRLLGRRRNYVGAHRTVRLRPACDPWGSAPLFPQNYGVLYAGERIAW